MRQDYHLLWDIIHLDNNQSYVQDNHDEFYGWRSDAPEYEDIDTDNPDVVVGGL
jgi:hypothetical protein